MTATTTTALFEPTMKDGIRWTRRFSPTEDPYETIEFELRDVVLVDPTGKVVFEQRGILVPKFWSDSAVSIMAQHYLKGRQGTTERENAVTQAVDRVVNTIRRWAQEGRPEAGRPALRPLFFSDDDADAFASDLKYMLVTQAAGFNSPVWYNIGVTGVAQQPSACFILDVQDTMESITDWYRDEAFIFKGGSGAGLNLSNIRSSFEGLTKGGHASGPPAYARAADASAGTMASGGRTRRAAKMLVMNIDHPDILEQADGSEGFIKLKTKAEQIARTLRDAGFDLDVSSGKDGIHVQYQNANNSVRISNEFMEAVLAGDDFATKARRPDLIWKPTPVYKAQKLWREIAQAAWECADPGLQMDTTVNHWHTTPAAGRIEASNPCSEYMHINNSPCNLANTNLVKYADDDGSWLVDKFTYAVKMVALAQTTMGIYGDYPTDTIRQIAVGFRQIGQGYTSLGALLMGQGLPYDSDAGRAWAAAISSLMEATITRTSAQMAAVWGAYPGAPDLDKPGFDDPENRKAHLNVVEMRRQYHRAIALKPNRQGRRLSIKFGDEAHIDIFHNEVIGAGVPVKADPRLKALWEAGTIVWQEAIQLGNEFGYANAHMSVLAPMGTNGYIQENDTTGVEPGLGLRVVKKKVSGDTMYLAVQSAQPALRKLGYSEEDSEAIWAYIAEHNSVVNAPGLDPKDYPVFDTAFAEPIGNRFLREEAHLLMMAAAQPFISGAISKTVNMPEQVTVEDVERVYLESWRFGLKAVAIYRDNCKQTQPMSSEKKAAEAGPPPTVRFKLPRKVRSERLKVNAQDLELYVQVGLYPNGQPGEIFLTGPTQGSVVNGFLDGMAKQVSLALQHGTPIVDVVRLWRNMSFEPSGMLSPADSEFTSCLSVLDLLAQELALLFLDVETRHAMGIMTREERKIEVSGNGGHTATPATAVALAPVTTQPTNLGSGSSLQMRIKICSKCGSQMELKGPCFNCPNCGERDGGCS